jgi:K+-transporting ATPase ATPase C chain
MKRAFLALALFTLLLGFAYPLAIWGLGALFFPHHARGSLIEKEGELIGSKLIGQQFLLPIYFHSRPSAAAYDATASQSSNLGPTSKKLFDALQQRAAAYRLENHLPASSPIPGDAVYGSASGLDPHISYQNALLQAPRVAEARKQSVETIVTLIEKHKEEPLFSLFGTERVSVFLLNLALDENARNSIE